MQKSVIILVCVVLGIVLSAGVAHGAPYETSSDPTYDAYKLANLSVTVFDNAYAESYKVFSGIYPHLATMNTGRSECGIGAVAAWAESLWYVTYPSHSPRGSGDKLYQLLPGYHLRVRPESVGGTNANRMIHTPSNQLIIGYHFIDAHGTVRTIQVSKMPGRMTANAAHLTDPENKVYFVTMEEGIYEVDVNTLAVTTLHLDRNVGGGDDLLPGSHGKGAYTAQGRLIVTNNAAGGVLAEWDGSGDAGDPSSWTIVDRNKYTDVTGPGGIYGAPDQNAPGWAIGWDHKSVLLNVCDQGGKWERFRLPKASYTQDADNGCFTEWPRIREAAPNLLLMDMHCMFYEFPKTFSHSNTAGIRPICTHLKMMADFTNWNGQFVQACDDASHFGNPLLGRAQSNLKFGSVDDLRDLGRPLGWGGPWIAEPVEANQPSEPYLVNGFDNRVVHFTTNHPSVVNVIVEIDRSGAGNWTKYATCEVPASGYAYFLIPSDVQAEWIRFRTDSAVKSATAYLHFSSDRQVLKPSLFRSLAKAAESTPRSDGVIRPHNDDDLTLHFAANIFDASGDIVDTSYYVIGQDMRLAAVNDASTESWLRANAATTKDFEVDEASVVLTDSAGMRFRLPKGDAVFDNPTASGWPRGIREVVTERSLMNIHGTIYELPREASGGLRKIRPIATHNRMIYDFCSWRGMLVLSGNLTGAVPDEHYIQSDDKKVGLWFGNVDDLFALGLPRGIGGPWKETAVVANEPSDPYLMTGYDKKVLELSHDLTENVDFTIEVDFLANNTWHKYATFTVPPGETFTHIFPKGYSAHWVRLKASRGCTATAQFIYNRFSVMAAMRRL